MSYPKNLGTLAKEMIAAAELEIEKLEDTIYSGMGELSAPVLQAKHEKLRLELVIVNLKRRALARNGKSDFVFEQYAARKERLMAKLEKKHPTIFKK